MMTTTKNPVEGLSLRTILSEPSNDGCTLGVLKFVNYKHNVNVRIAAPSQRDEKWFGSHHSNRLL